MGPPPPSIPPGGFGAGVQVTYEVKTEFILDADVAYFTDAIKANLAQVYKDELNLPADANVTVIIVPASVRVILIYTTDDVAAADTATATQAFSTVAAVQATVGDAVGVTALSAGTVEQVVTIVLPPAGMGVGALIGIIVGVLAGLGAAFMFYKYKKNAKAKKATFPA